jgi:hypothetical protein
MSKTEDKTGLQIKNYVLRLDLVIHTCNASYPGSRVWVDLNLTPAQAKKLETPSQPTSKYGGTCLLSQLWRKQKIGGSWSRSALEKM